jgi:hypothetical protein
LRSKRGLSAARLDLQARTAKRIEAVPVAIVDEVLAKLATIFE